MATICLVAASILAGQSAAGPPVVQPPPPIVAPSQGQGSSEALTEEERVLFQLKSGSAAQKAAAAAKLEAHPDLVEPFELIQLVGYLWSRGDKAQSAFWYYLWEQRSRPWAKLGSRDTEGALRASLRETIGPAINEWAGSDLVAERNLMLRAISYEERLPLFPGRPANIGQAAWLLAVAGDRAENDADSIKREFPIDEKSLAKLATARRKNGLYVGSWKDAGAPLPDAWR